MVVFDVNETIVNSRRQWEEWADWLGIERSLFFAALGSLVQRGRPLNDIFGFFDKTMCARRAEELRQQSGWQDEILEDDIYPDVLPALGELRKRGYGIGVAGNQSESAIRRLKELGIPADFFGSSAKWKVEKPAPEFFKKIILETGLPPEQVIYVGDRLDNDVAPAMDLGLLGVFLRRGYWGIVQANGDFSVRPTFTIKTLLDLPSKLDERFGSGA